MRVQYQVFRSSMKTWDTLFREAAVFAESIGEQRLINISHCSDGGDSLVTVWYWSK